MSLSVKQGPIWIGLVADEPIRVAGLVSVFEEPAQPGQRHVHPIVASAAELLANPALEYIVIDLQGSSGMESLEAARKARPDIRLIVIGPEGNDEMVMSAIVAGARGYLDLTAAPETVRLAIEVVTSGSIWAPRRLLAQLIDRLLKAPGTNLAVNPQITSRERQVLELVMKARSNREIAAELGIEERTVKAYVSKLMTKTGADNRIKLTRSAMNLEVQPDSARSRARRIGRPLIQNVTN